MQARTTHMHTKESTNQENDRKPTHSKQEFDKIKVESSP